MRKLNQGPLLFFIEVNDTDREKGLLADVNQKPLLDAQKLLATVNIRDRDRSFRIAQPTRNLTPNCRHRNTPPQGARSDPPDMVKPAVRQNKPRTHTGRQPLPLPHRGSISWHSPEQVVSTCGNRPSLSMRE